MPPESSAADPQFVKDLLESRNWWETEALRYERELERTFLLMGVLLIVGILAAFWAGVLIG